MNRQKGDTSDVRSAYDCGPVHRPGSGGCALGLRQQRLTGEPLYIATGSWRNRLSEEAIHTKNALLAHAKMRAGRFLTFHASPVTRSI